MKIVHTSKAPAAIGPYSQAIISDNKLYTSGQIALDPDSGALIEGDIKAQTLQVMANLAAVLAEAGTSFDKVIKTTCFLQTMDDFAAFNEVYAEYFIGKPARSCVEAARLPKNCLVEVELIAEI